MRNPAKLGLAGLVATCLLAFAVGTAWARRIELSEQGFLARWTTTRPLIVNVAGMSVSCPVTLEGSFHSRTLSKVCGQLIGYITSAQIPSTSPPCEGGTMTALAGSLPWHVQYNSFTGTLPNITRIRITMIGFRVATTPTGSITCLVGTTQTKPLAGDININGSHTAESFTMLPEFRIPGEGFCSVAGEASVSGTTAVLGTLVTPQVSITVRLVQ
jgi:hypothetical protein